MHLHKKRVFWKIIQVLFEDGLKSIQHTARTDVVAQVLLGY